MRSRFFALFTFLTSLSFAGSSFGQSLRVCDAANGAVVDKDRYGLTTSGCAAYGARWLLTPAYRLLSSPAIFVRRPFPRGASAPGHFFGVRLSSLRPFVSTPDNWVGGTGNWSTAADWTAGVPTSSSAATIGNTSSGFVTEDLASASAASLSIVSGNTLDIVAGKSLTVGGTTSVSSGGQVR